METTPLDSPRAHALLSQALRGHRPRLDLAALSVAALEYPEVNVAACERMLSGFAQRVMAHRGDGSLLSQVQSLRRVLSDEEGFRGNESDYDTPENSFLNRVLETKFGLPISLSVVYLEVARRADIPLFGVSFPGHFLVAGKVDEERKLVLDPFHGAQVLTETGCEDLLKRIAPQLRFTPRMLTATPVKAVTYRMLNNLKRVYLERGDGERALRVVDLMLAVMPDHPGELRARASILSALGAYRAALSDVERCLELSPDAPDHQNLQLTARALRQRMEFLN